MDPVAPRGQRPRAEPAPLPALLAVLWPVGCAGCGAPDEGLCRRCARPLRERTGRVAALAGTSAPGAPPTWATAEYTGAVRSAVVAWKDRDRADVGRWLVPALAEAVQAAVEQAAVLAQLSAPAPAPGRAAPRAARAVRAGREPLVLVPVPSGRAVVRRRGRDAVADLSRGTAALLRRRGVPVLAVTALRQGRRLRDQAGLDARARTGNLSGALRPTRKRLAPGSRVVLVDDVVTTGATLAEAARVLAAVGVEVVAAAAVAATPRREPPAATSPAASSGPPT